ncbi:MAG: hypothetical protein LC135_13445 [Phycisphaerae bacterium]|jgi:hypothetical protein|nr:hypothetical protein [Phycisphaerae bacterium]MCZ2400857.1 hypothetical protein [Phycisphaerae bacterium]NUQ48966.1 hypothetical protein [Phycisphaerae bacterium]
MRCPACLRPAEVTLLKYSELDSENQLRSVETAHLSCGCRVAISDLNETGADESWEARARRRRDDQLRSVFS